MANHIYTYQISGGRSLYGLVSAVENHLSDEEGMETQRLTDEKGATVLQARAKGGKWKQFIGLDKALAVRFSKVGSNEVRMEVGESKWVDKGVVMTVSMFVLWPLAVTSGVGMYKQAKLPEHVDKAARE